MCPPDHFDVLYRINPWMGHVPVDRLRAQRQWRRLRDIYRDLGHCVIEVASAPGLPDMVFVANPALVIDGRAVISRFRHDERAREADLMNATLVQLGVSVAGSTDAASEGEGDFVVVGDRLLGGWGFRTQRAAHSEVADLLARDVISLELLDPRFYHLDTALAAVDHSTIAYYPGAFEPRSRVLLRELFPDAVLATEQEADALALNFVSDGSHVVLEAGAPALAGALRERGLAVIETEMTEFHKAGGGIKCCTAEWHTTSPVRSPRPRRHR